jgi:hypothetical protein
VIDGGKSPSAVAKELGLWTSVVCGWVKQAKIDRVGGGVGVLTSVETEKEKVP